MPGLLLLWACTDADTPQQTSPLDGGWPAVLMEDPQAFGAAVESDREGWIKLHQGDLHGALAAGGAPASRAASDMAAVEADLSAMAAAVWEKTFSTWEARSGLPEGSAIPVVAALSALDVGDDARAGAWLTKGASYTDPDIATIAASLRNSGDSTLAPRLAAAAAAAPAAAISRCLAGHAAARSGNAAELEGCPDGALITEQADSHTRTLFDPLRYTTLSEVYSRSVTLSGGEMPTLLFSGRWSSEDSSGVPRATLTKLGLGDGPGEDAQSARDFVRALDDRLDAWQRDAAPGNVEGAALLTELQAVGVFRAHALTAVARQALADGHPQVALAVGQLALDVEHSRAIGPLNPPGVFAVLASASFQSGRTREALEYLTPLAPSWPEVVGLDETLSDLVVLENLERVGDSKEN